MVVWVRFILPNTPRLSNFLSHTHLHSNKMAHSYTRKQKQSHRELDFPLPTDLVGDIAERLPPRSILNLAQTSRAVYHRVKAETWKRDIKLKGIPALYRAIYDGDAELVDEALSAYHEQGADGMLDGTAVQWHTFPKDFCPAPQSKREKAWLDTGHPGASGGVLPRHAISNFVYAPPATLAVRMGNVEVLKRIINHRARVPLDAPIVKRWEHSHRFGYKHPWPKSYFTVEDRPDWCSCRGKGQDERYYTSSDRRHRLKIDFCDEAAIHLAVHRQEVTMARLLLEAGSVAGLNKGKERYVEWNWKTPTLLHKAVLWLQYAGYESCEEDMDLAEMMQERPDGGPGSKMVALIKMLLARGANPNIIYPPPRWFATNFEVFTILHWALWCGESEAAKTLIRGGADWWWPSGDNADTEWMRRNEYPRFYYESWTIQNYELPNWLEIKPICFVPASRALAPMGLNDPKTASFTIDVIRCMLDEGGWDGSPEPLDELIKVLATNPEHNYRSPTRHRFMISLWNMMLYPENDFWWYSSCGWNIEDGNVMSRRARDEIRERINIMVYALSRGGRMSAQDRIDTLIAAYGASQSKGDRGNVRYDLKIPDFATDHLERIREYTEPEDEKNPDLNTWEPTEALGDNLLRIARARYSSLKTWFGEHAMATMGAIRNLGPHPKLL